MLRKIDFQDLLETFEDYLGLVLDQQNQENMAQNKQENQILKHLMDLDQGPRYDMLIIKEVVIKMIKM